MRRGVLALLLAAAWPFALEAQADTTVCTAFRVIRANTGRVTTSVTKVPCGGTTRVDTVLVQPTPAPVPEDPRGWNCWTPRDTSTGTCIPDAQAPLSSQTLVLRAQGKTFGYQRYMWRGIITATDPAMPQPGTVRVDTVYLPPPAVPPPVPPPVVTPAPEGARLPELPRATVDTRMPAAPAPGGVIIRVPEG
jgi:hypothetical protein